MVAIAILDDYQDVALTLADWSRLKQSHRITVFCSPMHGEEELASALIGFDVLCVMRERTPISAALIRRLPNLRLVVTSGARNAAIDMDACAQRRIPVLGTESPGHATAELAFGLILALARHIPEELTGMRKGAWQTTVGFDLRGRTLGILGLGRLGAQVARIGAAFGMKLIAWSENLTAQHAYECGVERVDKDTLLQRSDVLTIHTRLSPRTRGIIGARELSMMKASALLINTSRGPIVDEAALLDALRSGRIAGAGIDVYGTEPLPADHPLRGEPRALLTPHLGYVTEQTYRIFYGGMVECIEGWLDGTLIREVK